MRIIPILIILLGAFIASGCGTSVNGNVPFSVNEKQENLNAESSVREFAVFAKQWDFSPNPIEVNKGDVVKLSITSLDVAHGFALPEFGIDERLEPGKTVVVQFVADKAGRFDFFCNVPCGEGHQHMTGTLIVR